MKSTSRWTTAMGLLVILGAVGPLGAQEPTVDLSGYRPDCGVAVRREGSRLSLAWPMARSETGQLVLDLRPGQPLIDSVGLTSPAVESRRPLLAGADPVTYLLVGSRQAPGSRPPEMSDF